MIRRLFGPEGLFRTGGFQTAARAVIFILVTVNTYMTLVQISVSNPTAARELEAALTLQTGVGEISTLDPLVLIFVLWVVAPAIFEFVDWFLDGEESDRAQVMGPPNHLLTVVISLVVYVAVAGQLQKYFDVHPIVALVVMAVVPMSLGLAVIIARHELRKRGVLS